MKYKVALHETEEGISVSVPGLPGLPRANPVNAYTMGGIAKDAGLTVEQFKNLL